MRVQLCNKKDASIKSGMGNGFMNSRMKNIKNGESTLCVWGKFSPSSPLHCINTHVRYVNDLNMYAKLSPNICFMLS